jgi:hypothetical protein
MNSVKIKIQSNSNSYEKYTDNYGECNFIFRDATLTPVNITGYFVDLGSGYVQYYPDSLLNIQIVAKQSNWVEFIVFKPPMLNNPVKLTNPSRISLTWSVDGNTSGNSYFVIQRKKAGESDFTNITSPDSYYNYYNYSYFDQSYTTGVLNQYRIMCYYGPYYNSGNSLLTGTPTYSNIVSITP